MSKYGELVDTFGDEPVFVLRAKDIAALPTLGIYLSECIRLGARTEHLGGVMEMIMAFSAFRRDHYEMMHVPD